MADYVIQFDGPDNKFKIEHSSDALHNAASIEPARVLTVIRALDDIHSLEQIKWVQVSDMDYRLLIEDADKEWDVTYRLNGPSYFIVSGTENGWTIADVELIQSIRARCAELTLQYGALLIRFWRP